ncbi:glycosyltransferase family 4 protein [Pseudidiomarina sp. 1ASP75-14]|uniref:glycosyltransferase family 4 protein n=1 Tax=Pseudidiomarina terrestris TaxID=2820060 RepID=UPI00265180B1|nr:glycosyltransferase family 4 protein [Pseudidiomarina sp. 1ASP75-14]MDN7136777.1 glycosyltransferase family 4 protein [Pseudidiomarina sp. 1ASP75-14]
MSNSKVAPHRVLVIAGFNRSLINFRGPLIKALCDTGLEVHAAAPELLSDAKIVNSLSEWGVSCHDLPFERARINPSKDLMALAKLIRLIRKVRPDLTLAYTIKPVIYGTLSAWLAGVPRRVALITGLGYAFTGDARGKRMLVQKVVRKLYGVALGKAELVFFQNPDDERLFRKLNLIPQRVPSKVVNGSGVDLIEFKNEPLPKKQISFLLIARLLGDKGVREYVRAAREVRENNSRILFRLAGAVDENPDSIRAEEISAWQDEGVIEYLGQLDDVRPALKDCSVYVLPSYREGTPRTVLEAMANGRPIITTDAPGCRETVVNGDNGFLVAVKSVQALVLAMERFIKEPELIEKMGKRSREIACEKYDVNKVNESMLKAMELIKK